MVNKKRIAINSHTSITDDEWIKFRVKLIKKGVTITKWIENKIRKELKNEDK